MPFAISECFFYNTMNNLWSDANFISLLIIISSGHEEETKIVLAISPQKLLSGTYYQKKLAKMKILVVYKIKLSSIEISMSQIIQSNGGVYILHFSEELQATINLNTCIQNAYI